MKEQEELEGQAELDGLEAKSNEVRDWRDVPAVSTAYRKDDEIYRAADRKKFSVRCTRADCSHYFCVKARQYAQRESASI